MLSKDVIPFTLIAIFASVVGWQISMLLTNGLIIVFAILFVLFMGNSIDSCVWNWLDELLMLF
ncbi:MAG: hypothetical protein NZQ09_15000, partial [Chloroflexus sp.]|nr:hypothetical protein [Chloroflexus sp.]